MRKILILRIKPEMLTLKDRLIRYRNRRRARHVVTRHFAGPRDSYSYGRPRVDSHWKSGRFSVQLAFVTNICLILTIQKANYTLSDLLFRMTVLAFTYLVGLMVFSSRRPRGRQFHAREGGGIWLAVCLPTPGHRETRKPVNLEFNQEPDQICKYQEYRIKLRCSVAYIDPQTNKIAQNLAIPLPQKSCVFAPPFPLHYYTETEWPRQAIHQAAFSPKMYKKYSSYLLTTATTRS